MRTFQLCILLVTSMSALAVADPPTAAAKPNIVVLLVDDMGYGDPGCYNPKSKIATPHIDRLAREGMRFIGAHAPGPVCHPSRYGLMTGRYPFRTDNLSDDPAEITNLNLKHPDIVARFEAEMDRIVKSGTSR